MTTPPCRRRAGHHHVLAYDIPNHPRERRRQTSDRCNSLLLWSTAAWALLTDRNPTIDGVAVVWPTARDYLEHHAAKHTGGLARRALKMVDR